MTVKFSTFAAAVALAVAAGNPAQAIVEAEAKAEIARRTGVIGCAFSALKNIEQRLAELNKPDVITYTTPGDDATKIEEFSAGRKKAIEDTTKRRDELAPLVDKLLENGTDFADAEAAYKKWQDAGRPAERSRW